MHDGARSGQSLRMLGIVLPMMRRLAMFGKYWSPALNDSTRAPPLVRVGRRDPRQRSGAPRTDERRCSSGSAGVASPVCTAGSFGLFENTPSHEV